MDPPDPLGGDPELQRAFSNLVKSLPPQRPRPTTTNFVKKLDVLQEVHLPPTIPRMAAISLAEKGLIGQFTGLWPSPKTMQRWVERNWSDKTQGKISIRFCGRGYFTFHFETKEDKDLIFRNGPYFMDSRGLYLNKWTSDFDPELDIPSAVPVWVRLPHLPLHCWGDDSVKAIGNAVGKYIDRSEPKENMQACAQICVEVDLGRGLPEAIKLKVDDWSHIQQLDYEQIPFKCKACHEYGHFANRCSKIVNVESEEQDGQWETVKRKKSTPPLKSMDTEAPGPFHQHPSHLHSSHQHPSSSSQQPPLHHPSSPPRIPDPPIPPSSNPFATLFEEEIVPDFPSSDPTLLPSPPHISQPSLDTASTRITRNYSKEHGAPSDIPKKHGPGRKSAKQQREENTQKDIAMGSQAPIESFILGHLDKENNNKGKERRAPLHVTSKT